MTTNYDATTLSGFISAAPRYGGAGMGQGVFNVLKFHIDMAKMKAALGTIDGATSDTIDIWDIPLGTHVLSVLLVVTGAEASAATVAIGDQNNAAGWCAATSLASVMTTTLAGTEITTDVYGLVGGRLYKAANTLRLTFGTLADIKAAVFDIYVIAAFLLPTNTVYTVGVPAGT